MRVLLSAVVLLTFLMFGACQLHYVPAQIFIPTLNISTIQNLHNKTQPINNTGWNNPLLNKTAVSSFKPTNSNGDLLVGTINSMDHRLFKQSYRKAGRWWSGREKLIEYPKDLPGHYGRHETISAIRAYNQYSEGVDAKAEVVAGGIGSRYAKIKLSSGWGKGFNYLVVIYGH